MSDYNSAYTGAQIDNAVGAVIEKEKIWDGKANSGHTHTPESIGAAPSSHTHDDRYYTEEETDNLLKDKADKSVSFAVTLPADGWAENAQTVSDARFLAAGYAYIVSPAPSNFTAYGDAGIYAEDVTTDGQMVFHCDSVPDVSLIVNIIRVVSV